MVSELILIHNNKEHKDFSFIDLESVEAGDKSTFHFIIKNPTKFEMRKMELISNVPKDHYTVTGIKTLEQNSELKMSIDLDTKKLFKTDLPNLMFALKYKKTKVFA